MPIKNLCKKRVVVVGGGFSGLISSYYLSRAGFQVAIYEKAPGLGGLIHTREGKWGLAETAASSIVNSEGFEALCKEIKLPLVRPKQESKARFLFRNGPSRWPLTFLESLGLGRRVIWQLVCGGKKSFKPRPHETISEWGGRVFGPAFVNFLLGPALQGIYAEASEQLSASLIMDRFFAKKINLNGTKGQRQTRQKLQYGGTIAPKHGMEDLIKSLKTYLLQAGVDIHTNREMEAADFCKPGGPAVVLCTNVQDAGYLMESWIKLQEGPKPFPDKMLQFARRLQKIRLIPMVSATAFYKKKSEHLAGFGCLFPRNQGVRSLGVLFNSSTFIGRSNEHSETWMIALKETSGISEITDEEVATIIKTDRRRLYQGCLEEEPLEIIVTRWPKSVPAYDRHLEEALDDLELPQDFHLVGNYMGGIGLSKIMEQAQELPNRMLVL